MNTGLLNRLFAEDLMILLGITRKDPSHRDSTAFILVRIANVDGVLSVKIVKPEFVDIPLEIDPELRASLESLPRNREFYVTFCDDGAIVFKEDDCDRTAEIDKYPIAAAVVHSYREQLVPLAKELRNFLERWLPNKKDFRTHLKLVTSAAFGREIPRSEEIKIVVTSSRVTDNDKRPDTVFIYFDSLEPRFNKLGNAVLQAAAKAMLHGVVDEIRKDA